MTRLAMTTAACLITTAAKADEPTRGVLTLYWENDGTVLKPNAATDRHYTNGVGFSYAWQPDWADDALAHMPYADRSASPEATDTAAGFIVGHLIFTPEDILLTTPDPMDRPYAGYLFFGGYLQRSTETEDYALFDHFQLDLGLVGPSTRAEQIQTEVHELVDEDEPMGWDAQLGDEPTFQATVTRKWRIDLNDHDFDLWDRHWDVQVIPFLRARAGTVYVDGEGGAIVRAGWNLPDDFGPGFLQDVGDATGPGAPEGWSFYVYAGGSARGVAHNIFLNGGTFESGPSVDTREVVWRGTYGVAASYRWNPNCAVTVNFGQAYISPEFEEQDATGDGLGQLSVAFELVH